MSTLVYDGVAEATLSLKMFQQENIPVKWKLLIGGIPVLAVITWFIYMRVHGKSSAAHFYKNAIASTVISSGSFYGRSIEYRLQEGSSVFFRPASAGNKIAVGDSLCKEVNTYLYSIYRKDNNGAYTLVNTYNYEDIP